MVKSWWQSFGKKISPGYQAAAWIWVLVLCLVVVACTITVDVPFASGFNREGSPAEAQAPYPSLANTGGQPAPDQDILSGDDPAPGRGENLDFSELERYMLTLINANRQDNGLAPLDWDELSAEVGRRHAIEMADQNYLSHWNLQGQGPDVRYGLAGGTEPVQENVYSYFQRYQNGQPVPVSGWHEQIDNAQEALMDSPGHRAAILNPSHTHVGIGLAYNPHNGEFRVAQEFIGRYVEFEEPANQPYRAAPGSKVPIRARLLGDITNPVFNVAYQPFPAPMTIAELNATNSYISPAEVLQASLPLRVPGGILQEEVRLPNDPGYYHIRIWARQDGEDLFAANLFIVVSVP